MRYKSFWMSYANLDPKHNAVIEEFADGIEANIKARLLELGVSPDANSQSAISERVRYLDHYLLNRLRDPAEVEIAKCLVAHKFAFLTDAKSLIVTLECLSELLGSSGIDYKESRSALENLTSRTPNYPYLLLRETNKVLLEIIDTTLSILERQIRIGNLKPGFYRTLPGKPKNDDVLSFLLIQEIDLANVTREISKLKSNISWDVASGVRDVSTPLLN